MAIVGEAPEYFDTDPTALQRDCAVLDETIDWRGFAKGVWGITPPMRATAPSMMRVESAARATSVIH